MLEDGVYLLLGRWIKLSSRVADSSPGLYQMVDHHRTFNMQDAPPRMGFRPSAPSLIQTFFSFVFSSVIWFLVDFPAAQSLHSRSVSLFLLLLVFSAVSSSTFVSCRLPKITVPFSQRLLFEDI